MLLPCFGGMSGAKGIAFCRQDCSDDTISDIVALQEAKCLHGWCHPHQVYWIVGAFSEQNIVLLPFVSVLCFWEREY